MTNTTSDPTIPGMNVAQEAALAELVAKHSTLSPKTIERRGWLTEQDIRDHIAKHDASCRCRCRFCALAD